jgi:hypothetical protein
MNRVTAVSATLATAAMATAMAAAVIPAGAAVAAPRPAGAHPAAAKKAADAKAAAAHAGTATPKAAAPGPSFVPTTIGSELGGGKYVTVVHCQGVDSPPPVTVNKPGTPLIVNGGGPSAQILSMLKRPNPYKTVYTCTVTVQEKVPAKPKPAAKAKRPHQVHKKGCEIAASGHAGRSGHNGHSACTKPVTLNTGFGGLAPQVRDHHPAG